MPHTPRVSMLGVALCTSLAWAGCTPHGREAARAPVADDRTQLFEITHRGFAAIVARRPEIFGTFLAPEFILRIPGSPDVSRDSFLQLIRTPPVAILDVDGESIDARVWGDVGVVTGIQRTRIRLASREALDAAAFTDVFMRREGQWRMVFSHTIPLPAPISP